MHLSSRPLFSTQLFCDRLKQVALILTHKNMAIDPKWVRLFFTKPNNSNLGLFDPGQISVGSKIYTVRMYSYLKY